MFRHTYLYILLLLPLLAVGACGNKTEESEKADSIDVNADAEGSVRIAVTTSLDCLPVFIAKEKGLLDVDELTVTLVPYRAHMDIDTALINARVDGAFTDIIRSEKMRQLGTAHLDYLTSTELSWTLIANRAARLNRLEQFGDKMVAMTRYSATDYLTDNAFAEVKTNAPYFKVQINDAELRMKMLLNNEMDGAWLPEPYATIATLNGHKSMKTPKQSRYGVLAFRSKWAKNNQHTLKALSKVYSSMCDSINKNGYSHYADVIAKYCQVDTAVVNRLPKVVYTHVEKPSENVLTEARSFIGVK